MSICLSIGTYVSLVFSLSIYMNIYRCATVYKSEPVVTQTTYYQLFAMCFDKGGPCDMRTKTCGTLLARNLQQMYEIGTLHVIIIRGCGPKCTEKYVAAPRRSRK